MWERKTTHCSSLAGYRTIAPLPHGVPQIKGLPFSRSYYVESISLGIHLYIHHTTMKASTHRDNLHWSWIFESQPCKVFSEESSTSSIAFILSNRTLIAEAQCFLAATSCQLEPTLRHSAFGGWPSRRHMDISGNNGG